MKFNDFFLNALNVASVLMAVLGALAALVILGVKRLKLGTLEFEVERALSGKALVKPDQATTSSNRPPHTTALGRQQYTLLEEYHSQGLAQSKISFWFSLIFAAIGFSVVIFAIALYLREEPAAGETLTSSLQKPGFTLVAGTVIEAVAALFFVQSNRARQLMTEFFDRLRIDRKLDESLRLAAEISDTEIQSCLMAVLSLSFADVSAEKVLAQVLGKTLSQPSSPPEGSNAGQRTIGLATAAPPVSPTNS